MPVPTDITDLSTTAVLNSPAGTDAIGGNPDDYLRAHASFIAQLYATVAGASTTIGRVVAGGPSYGSYGGISLTGQTGGYSGLAFNEYTSAFLVNSTVSGVLRNNTTWDWYWLNGTLTAGTVPWARLSNVPTTLSTAASFYALNSDPITATSSTEAVNYTASENVGSNFNETTGRFTAPANGVYLFSFYLGAVGFYATADFKVNGALSHGGIVVLPGATGCSTKHITLTAGQYVSVFARTASSGGTANVSPFSCVRLS